MVALILVAGFGARAADPIDSQKLPGRRPSAQEVAAADITVFPDGAGLPAGQATAREGRGVYDERCAACHGPKGSKPLLTVGSYWPYATTLWDYTRRAMPYQQPGSLTPNEVYAVTAYVLYLNGIVAEGAVLDQTTLPTIHMPNRDGFVPDPRRR